MRKFKFRLEKLLEYRHLQEKWAKDAFLSARAKRIDCEVQIEGVKDRRNVAGGKNYATLDDRRAQEQFLGRLEDERRSLEAAASVLAGEEEIARQKWLSLKQDAEALEKLKAKDFELWSIEERREVQKELDEWSVQRRAS